MRNLFIQNFRGIRKTKPICDVYSKGVISAVSCQNVELNNAQDNAENTAAAAEPTNEGGESFEELLLQGVVDLWFEDEAGVTVVDFKSDRIAPGAEADRAEDYRPQLTAYSTALQTILGVERVKTVLWFFHTATAVEL